LSVALKGHTDNVGNAAKNTQLSKQRAEAVKNYLVSKGVSASVIQTYGFGSTQPIATNNTPEGRAQNRRVEIEVFVR
jgi:OOP family OmpA-OmpF porin